MLFLINTARILVNITYFNIFAIRSKRFLQINLLHAFCMLFSLSLAEGRPLPGG